MIIKTKDLLKTGAAFCALACLPLGASAQEVRLTSTDGFIDFSGALVSFADGVYTIDTSMGRLTFPATEVTCEGEACPETNEVASAFQIIGSPAILGSLIPELLDNYSLDADTDIIRSDAGGGGAYQLLTFEGEPVADDSIIEEPFSATAHPLSQ